MQIALRKFIKKIMCMGAVHLIHHNIVHVTCKIKNLNICSANAVEHFFESVEFKLHSMQFLM